MIFCKDFHLYLTIIIQPWFNQAQKIRLANYSQTVQLVIFLSIFNILYMYHKIQCDGNLEIFFRF